MSNKPTILVVEDEIEICKFLEIVLQDFNLKFANNGCDALRAVALYPPDIMLLDLGLPDIDGIEIIEKLRQWSQIPIIILSARGLEEQKVKALEAGANDYLTKPFGSLELLARIKVILRYLQKNNQNSSSIFENEDLKIDLENRQVFVKNCEIHLTKIEYKLLSILVINAGKVLTHTQLLKEVWGKNSTENNHYLRIYTQHLRDKLGDDALNPKYIFTETGVGYRFLLNSA